jgi:hypothetical protein
MQNVDLDHGFANALEEQLQDYCCLMSGGFRVLLLHAVGRAGSILTDH